MFNGGVMTDGENGRSRERSFAELGRWLGDVNVSAVLFVPLADNHGIDLTVLDKLTGTGLAIQLKS